MAKVFRNGAIHIPPHEAERLFAEPREETFKERSSRQREWADKFRW